MCKKYTIRLECGNDFLTFHICRGLNFVLLYITTQEKNFSPFAPVLTPPVSTRTSPVWSKTFLFQTLKKNVINKVYRGPKNIIILFQRLFSRTSLLYSRSHQSFCTALHKSLQWICWNNFINKNGWNSQL